MTERLDDAITERDHLRSLLNQVCNILDRDGGPGCGYNDIPVAVSVMDKKLRDLSRDKLIGLPADVARAGRDGAIKEFRSWLEDKGKRGNVFSVKAALDFIDKLEKTP